MPTPRTRQHSATTTWPQLSLLTVYSSIPLIDSSSSSEKLSDEELEAAKILYFHAQHNTTGEVMTPERRRRLLGTVMGVADFAKMMTKSGGDNKIRSVKSSKRRMIWIEPEDGIFVHATIVVPRQSSSRRHARETSTATNSSSRSAPSDSSTPLDDQLLISTLEKAYRLYRLQSGSVLSRLKRDGKEETIRILTQFWSDWIGKWDLSVSLNLENALREIMGGLPMSPLLTPPTLAQLAPLLTQLSASNPSISPILFHASHVLHVPSAPLPSFLANDTKTLESLIQHLLALHTSRLLSLLPSESDSQESSSTSQMIDQAESSSSWTSSALSYLDPRNVPFPSTTTTASFLLNPFNTTATPVGTKSGEDLRKDFAQLRKHSRRRMDSNNSVSTIGSLRSKKESRREASESVKPSESPGQGEKESEGGWGLRSVSKSWSRLGAAFSGSGSSTPEAPPVPPLPTTTSGIGEAESEGIKPLVSNELEATQAHEGNTDSLAPGAGNETPGTPAVELAPEVNEEELREAMERIEIEVNPSADVSSRSEDSPEVSPTEEAGGKIAEKEAVLGFFGGEADERFEVRLVARGLLTLALVSPALDSVSSPVDMELLNNRSARLLEAVETILEATIPSTSTSNQPTYAVKSDGRLYSRIPQPVPAKLTTESEPSDPEALCALLDAHRSLNSSLQILESLTRLPASSNWLSLARSFHIFPAIAPSTTPSSLSPETQEETEKTIDLLSILPAKNARGRETTLVEAAEGARRIERKWLAQRCGP